MMTINTSKESHISFINALTIQSPLQIMKKNITTLAIVLSNFQIWVVCQNTAAVVKKKQQQQH